MLILVCYEFEKKLCKWPVFVVNESESAFMSFIWRERHIKTINVTIKVTFGQAAPSVRVFKYG